MRSVDGRFGWRIKRCRWNGYMLVMIMLVNLNWLFVRYRDRIRRCYRHGNFDTNGDFYTNWDMHRNFDSNRNLNRDLNRYVLDYGDFNRNGLGDSIGLGHRNGLRHSIRDSVRLRDGDGCSNWVRKTVAVAFAESFFKTLFIMMGLERSFIGRQTHSL